MNLKKIGKITLLSFCFLLFVSSAVSFANNLEQTTISLENSQQLEENLTEIGSILKNLSQTKTPLLNDLASLQTRQDQLATELEQSQNELREKTLKLREVESSLKIVSESLEKAESEAKKIKEKPNKINVAILVGEKQSYLGVRYITKNYGAGAYKKIYGNDGSNYFVEINYTALRF